MTSPLRGSGEVAPVTREAWKPYVPSQCPSRRRGRVRVRATGPGRSLTIEPSAGFSPVYNLNNNARHSINVTMYEFSDTTAEHDLGATAQRGVQTRVILDQRAKSVNSGAPTDRRRSS